MCSQQMCSPVPPAFTVFRAPCQAVERCALLTQIPAQALAGMSAAGFKGPMPAEILELAQHIFSVGTTKGDEDVFQRLRAAETHHQNAPVMCPARVWRTAVNSNVLAGRSIQDLKLPRPDADVGDIPAKLPDSPFKPFGSCSNLRLEEVLQSESQLHGLQHASRATLL